MTPPPGSASYFAQLSRDLMSHPDEDSLVAHLADTALHVAPTATAAAVATWRRDGTVTQHASGGPADVLERLQREARHARGAPGTGGVVVVRLDTADEVVGALALHADQPFGDAERELAEVYAVHATNAILATRTAADLRGAIEVRHVLGVATGVLAQSRGLEPDEALAVLSRHADLQGIGLAQVAAHVVAHGRLPGEADGVHHPDAGT